MFQRLELLIDNSSFYIVQRGGIGTLSEVFLALDIIRKDKTINTPKVLFIGTIWNEILKSVQTILPEKECCLFVVIDDINELNEYLS